MENKIQVIRLEDAIEIAIMLLGEYEYAYCGDEHYILKKKGYEETILVKAKDSTEALNKILNMIRG